MKIAKFEISEIIKEINGTEIDYSFKVYHNNILLDTYMMTVEEDTFLKEASLAYFIDRFDNPALQWFTDTNKAHEEALKRLKAFRDAEIINLKEVSVL